MTEVPADPSPDRDAQRWRGVVAALLNDDARAVLAETARRDLTPARRARALDRLEAAGLVRLDEGEAVFDEEGIRALLASPSRPAGPERFLDRTGRIDRYPATGGDRAALLAWVAARAFGEAEVLSEAEVNERLLPYSPGGDVAVLRRYLVDHELLERTRSGSQYAAVQPESVDADD